MKLESYWLDTVSPFANAEQDNPSGQYDVAIVGGGFTGLSAALALAKQSVSVVLLEANQVVGEASGRNGGQCNAGLAHDYASLAQGLGVDRARAFYASYMEAVDTVEKIVKDELIECDFTRHGRLKLACKPRHYDQLRRAQERLFNEVDEHVSVLDAQQVADELGTDYFYGGLLQTTSAQMHMGKFGHGLAQAASQHGAKIYQSAAVTAIDPVGTDNYQITTAQGSVKANKVLLATGSSKQGPFAYFRRRLVSVGSFIIVTEPLSDSLLAHLMMKRRSYVTTKNIGYYFRITPDNRLLFGGRARFAMSSPSSDAKSGQILRDAMVKMFPQLSSVRIDYCWGGLVDMTADRLPRAGQHKGLYYSLGYSGHGVQMSTHMGKVMAEVMQGKEGINPWQTLDWPPVPGHFGKPWFLPMVGAYYRFKDLIQ
ncbi:FAD-binding oxidoreductase [Marinomonas sp. THO17]|uniref:NAD(P)/FAD-dependent oxidoreductase n=1 Tax=Marinomonas sp. THO17 TaxID=3149048 RepID=UPI00336BCA05